MYRFIGFSNLLSSLCPMCSALCVYFYWFFQCLGLLVCQFYCFSPYFRLCLSRFVGFSNALGFLCVSILFREMVGTWGGATIYIYIYIYIYVYICTQQHLHIHLYIYYEHHMHAHNEPIHACMNACMLYVCTYNYMPACLPGYRKMDGQTDSHGSQQLATYCIDVP